MFAIVEIAGKQYKVQKGDALEVDKLKDSKEGDKISVDKVLVKFDDKNTDIGIPYVAGVRVELLVKKHIKGDKIRVFKKKPKKRYERAIGHRQEYTKVEVVAIK